MKNRKQGKGCTLIAIAPRRRVANSEKAIAIKMVKSKVYRDQQHLHISWKKLVDKALAQNPVPCCGVNGLYSLRTRNHVESITAPEKVFYITSGLGLVSERDHCVLLPEIRDGHEFVPNIENGQFESRDFWSFVSENIGTSITRVTHDAINRGEKVLITLNQRRAWHVENDLKELATMNPEILHKHLRVFGDVEDTLPVELLPCLMPVNSESLDAVIPGTRFNRALRYAALYVHVVSEPSRPNSANKDFREMDDAMSRGERLPGLDFHSTQREACRVTDLADAMIPYARDNHFLLNRIIRQMRADGWAASRVKFEQAFERARERSGELTVG